MGDRLLGVARGDIRMARFAVQDGFIQFGDRLIHMLFTLSGLSSFGMCQCHFRMLNQDVGMSQLSMAHGSVGMFEGLRRMTCLLRLGQTDGGKQRKEHGYYYWFHHNLLFGYFSITACFSNRRSIIYLFVPVKSSSR